MKKVKAILRSVIIFVMMMITSMLPTLMLRTEEEMNALLRQPEYWVHSVAIAAIVTWLVMQVINNSKK